ncbi:MBL fold metallo-hydrolase [Roseibaca sp. Y0-43]|uniref:MBL fold metallo-hydrolase n=1 Tax=Roseibaca sp. Y0-43 TaxID=2816854 RepID=UPI001D0C097D|nr:MBL fold metallo-hydrolase [Roseibaca sp. Y0-43]
MGSFQLFALAQLRNVALAMGCLVALLACAMPQGAGWPRASEPVLPDPCRAAGIATVAAGSVMGVFDTNGAPQVFQLGPEARRDGTVTWLGHAALLVRLGGKSVLIDPILTERLDIPLLGGPRRIAPAPDLRLDRVDAVLITHADHDHYNMRTLSAIARAYPDAELLTPPGLKAEAQDLGFRAVSELALWAPRQLGDLEIIPVPAVHYGRRDVLGFIRTKAYGYRLNAGTRSLFVAGDTAQGEVFSEIRDRLGPVRLAVLPIGAFAPEPFFADVQTNPEGAMQIARQLQAGRVLGYHWGTYQFSPTPPTEIRARFLASGTQGGPQPMDWDIGETVTVCGG